MFQNNFSDREKEKFIEHMEIYLLNGFGKPNRRNNGINDIDWLCKTQINIQEILDRMKFKSESQRRKKKEELEQELRKETHEKAIKLMTDAKELNKIIALDIETNPLLYSNLLKRIKFSSHYRCKQTRELYREPSVEVE